MKKLAIAIMLCLMCVSLMACSGSASVGYQPPVLPIKISINTNGQLEVSWENSIQTPYGTFSAEISSDLSEIYQDKKGVLIVNINGVNSVYDLNGQNNIAITLESGYYRQVELRKGGSNWYFEAVKIPEANTPIPPTPDQVGYLIWELKDNSTGQLLDSGNSVLLKNDIYTDTGTLEIGATYYEQSIALNPSFAIGISLVPENNQSDVVGFGLVLKRRDIDTFSWDWFDIQQNTRIANKLQGGGQVEYAIGAVKSGWDISYVNFLTDIILRANRMPATDIANPDWTVTIAKGSFIYWPPP